VVRVLESIKGSNDSMVRPSLFRDLISNNVVPGWNSTSTRSGTISERQLETASICRLIAHFKYGTVVNVIIFKNLN